MDHGRPQHPRDRLPRGLRHRRRHHGAARDGQALAQGGRLRPPRAGPRHRVGAACRAALRDLDAVAARVRAHRDELYQRLAAGIPGLAVNGHPELRLPNTLNVSFPGVLGAAVLAGAPALAASTGSAGHEGVTTASAVLLAMGVPPALALGAVRLTLGRATTAADVATAADALIGSWRRLSMA